MQLQRRSDGETSRYFVFRHGELLGHALHLDDVLLDRLDRAPSALIDAPLTVPCEPSKIICIGLNYRKHAEEMGKELPAEPLIFSKPPSSLLPDGGMIELPSLSEEVHYEGELAVVIGRRCRDVRASEAEAYILGYTLLNDVTARDLQRRDVQYTRGKGFDTFAPVGPQIVSGLRPEDLQLELRVNGELRQSSPVSDMIFSVAEIVEHVSAVMTLELGDIIATGTPSGVGALSEGDEVSVTIPEIGVLRNTVGRRA